MRRVVVTGMGMVTPLGRDLESSWSALQEGRSGVGPISLFNAETRRSFSAILRSASSRSSGAYAASSSFTRRARRTAGEGFRACSSRACRW